MTKEMMFSKIHRASVRDANLEYEGSITIDEMLLEKSGILEYQKVDILNINNGERFQTYAIKGEYGSGDICVNGAGARKVQAGDKIIIIAYASYDEKELASYKPKMLFLDNANKIVKG